MSVSDPSDTIDKSVQLPIMMPPTWWVSTTARASAASLTPTISSCASLSRVDMLDSSAGPSPHAGAGISRGRRAAVAAIAGVVPESAAASCGAGGQGHGGAHRAQPSQLKPWAPTLVGTEAAIYPVVV